MSNILAPTPTSSSYDYDDSYINEYYYGAGGAILGVFGLSAFMFCYGKLRDHQISSYDAVE